VRLLLAFPQLPWPPTGGARARHWHLFRHVAAHHECHVFALRPPGEPTAASPPASPFASVQIIDIPTANPPRFSPEWIALRIRSVRHPAAAWYQPRAREAFALLARTLRPDAIVYGMSWMLPYALSAPGIPGIADEHNYDPQITERTAATRHGLDGMKWRAYARITASAERRNLREVRGIAACSEPDAAIFRHEAPHADVEVVPNGVDTASFTPSPPGDGVVMTGSFSYAPNRDGAFRLVRTIWPLVRQRVPSATLRLVGLRGETELRDLAGEPGVTVVGTVDDMRPELARARVAVAPIAIGGGTRIKILEAFAAARPVVSTTVGAEGIDARDGDTLLLRDDDAGFASAIGDLLLDAGRARAMGERGRALATSRYDWALSAQRFEALLKRVVR
jgi:glycosyltransferase involved in cell wall biosynthesis